MLRIATTFLLTIFFVFGLLTSDASAGDFSFSCQDTGLNGTTLISNCRRIDGSLNGTSIDLNSIISNQDGRLSFGGSGYAFTCGNVGLNNNILSGDCRRIDGSFTSTSIDLNNCITNRDGLLRFEC